MGKIPILKNQKNKFTSMQKPTTGKQRFFVITSRPKADKSRLCP
ncbi:hypothetical protein SynRS9902_00147 [Synechococcus sp. RS9902]|nr:hypothetical protein SynRS9902_00147 [Synechococcus sp. RS9902]